ncbi:type II toxin-antitoxin system VapC family toxin [Rhizomicrobium electricum]|jgi:PIN domain nuclease of toxin-antitoxin system|uniref:Type II toxin-antitoxin system VapC family toxin n=1 Tax=Rhizomicrobium electricum TaxID=480070 RepID=A0ABN1E6L3_9PROT|nr:type II toxin-antitoxin system VapC family toxin [Rhizomicrobium electricum]NIJ47739.1 PIN domain nuclease of toxin-antitoxin system [Rhizomicrobium electricum]
MTALLLDTCATIWISQNEPIAAEALEAIDKAARDGDPIYVSPMTAWEIGLLNARGRLAMAMSPEDWFASLMQVPGMALAELPPKILIASSFLPGDPPRDPADRIIAATARALRLQLVTRDRILLDYAEQGHIQAIAC